MMSFLQGMVYLIRRWFDCGGLVGQLRAMSKAIGNGRPLTMQEIEMLRAFTEAKGKR